MDRGYLEIVGAVENQEVNGSQVSPLMLPTPTSRPGIATRSSEPELTAASGNFWEGNNYESTTDRVASGSVLLSQLAAVMMERKKIEEEYLMKVKNWGETSSKSLRKNGEYGTILSGMEGVFSGEDPLSKFHTGLIDQLGEVVIDIESWRDTTYKEEVIDRHDKYKDRFKMYHFEWDEFFGWFQLGKKHFTQAEEKVKWAHDHDMDEEIKSTYSQGVKRRGQWYLDAFKNLIAAKPKFENGMKKTFEVFQDMEKMRKKYFKEIIQEYAKCLTIVREPGTLEPVNKFLEALNQMDEMKDLELWAAQKGDGMPFNFPTRETERLPAEDKTEEEHQPKISKQEAKKEAKNPLHKKEFNPFTKR